MRHSGASAILAGVCLALAACGGGDSGSSEDDFKAAFEERRAELAELDEAVGKAISDAPSQSDEAVAREFGRLADEAAELGDELEELGPPEQFQDELDDLTEALADGAGDLEAIAAAARSGDADKAASSAQQLVKDGEAIREASDALAGELGLKTETADGGGGKITVNFEQPESEGAGQIAALLEAAGLSGVAEGLTQRVRLPTDIRIVVRNGNEGPYYDPSDRTVNLSYGFADYVGAIIRSSNPRISDHDLGVSFAAVNDFILMHELGHAFVDVLEIPITGREEDSVDTLAATFFTDDVPNGADLAARAAGFFAYLGDNRGKLRESDFWDEHSLDKQRAYDILCVVAGSSQEAYQQIEAAQVIGPERLQRCPAEHDQKAEAWRTLMGPHLRD